MKWGVNYGENLNLLGSNYEIGKLGKTLQSGLHLRILSEADE